MDDLNAAVLQLFNGKTAFKSGSRIEIIRDVEADGSDPLDAVNATCPQCDIARRGALQRQGVLAVAACYILFRPRFVVDVEAHRFYALSGGSIVRIKIDDDLGNKGIVGS